MNSKASLLKANQAELKKKYATDPESAVQRLQASGKIDPENLAFEITQPALWTPTGLHPSSGGDGTFACSVELLLASLASCAGVTCAAVANSMKIEFEEAIVTAIGEMDFKGTLAVDRDAPVGLTKLELKFDIKSAADPEVIEKLVRVTERYCVVYQTFMSVPHIIVSLIEHN